MKRGKMVSFSGSVNETYAGYNENFEQFKTANNWDNTRSGSFQDDMAMFKDYWYDKEDEVEIMDIPDSISRKLLKIMPTEASFYKKIDELSGVDFSDYEDDSDDVSEEEQKKLEFVPWEPQVRAIEALESNNFNGVLKMATGTGKTFTSFCFKKIFENKGKVGKRILVIVPDKFLANQWAEGMKKNLDYLVLKMI